MRVYVVGGFLGAGKTTLVRALARHQKASGERVAVVTNDQGDALVDTYLCSTESAAVSEITGGCFCCRFRDLDAALADAEAHGATVVLAEAVGSCTDLIATVLSPLAERGRFALAPLAVVVDPWRLQDVESGRVHEDVAYLFRKQLQEADVVLTSRADLDAPDVSAAISAIAPDAAQVAVSGVTGAGLEQWLAARPVRPSSPLSIDYGRYADAEALLGWSNGRVTLRKDEGFDPVAIMSRFLEVMSDSPVAHVKLACVDPPGGSGSVTREGMRPVLDGHRQPNPLVEASFLVNARVALPPDELESLVRRAMHTAAGGGTVHWDALECFQPSPPEPTHRHSFRCGTDDDASCCAAFYDRAEVSYLLGDSLHPGGIDLTLRMAERLGLDEGDSVLDVACGKGTSLQAVTQMLPIEGFGLDAGFLGNGSGTKRSERIEFRRGDAHDIPYADGGFDALLCECAVSTFFDQPRALAEMRRVLKNGGRLAISDMVVEGTVPESLKEWVNVGTCLAGALSFGGYRELIEAAGFRMIACWDASDALREMIGRIKRNLLGLALAQATGNVPVEVDIDVGEGRALLKEAERAISDGVIGYGVYIAERVD